MLKKYKFGFDWTNYEYIKSFSKPILILICVYYSVFNVFIGSITEELFFRGYLTSHYEKRSSFTPVFITVLFSLYHFWLPFNNIFRIMAFAPVAYVAYKKRNIYKHMFSLFMQFIFSSKFCIGSIGMIPCLKSCGDGSLDVKSLKMHKLFL